MSDLWFTTATSTTLLEYGSAYSGLYKCSLNNETGECQSPQVLANSWYRDGRSHHDMPMMNVQLNLSNDDESSSGFVYSRTHDKKRDSWEIIRAPIGEEGVSLVFESYFRTEKTVEWNECGWKCCEPIGKAYVRVTPKSYFVEAGDVFVSWDGFYKDCEGGVGTSENPIWTVGVSRIKNDNSCVLNGDNESRNFALCTEVVSIVNQNVTGRSVALPFGGFAASRLQPSKERMFFMSAMRSEGIDAGVLSNEIWVFPEGGDFSKTPHLLQTFAGVEIHGLLFDEEVQDGGSIRLHTSDDGVVDHICRTAFDHSVSCFPIRLDETGAVSMQLDQEYLFANSVQIKESCSVDLFRDKPYYNKAASVTTGLDVQWDSNGLPDKVFFGCFGEIGGNGNFTAADRNGKIFTILPGAFPGSIAFGVKRPRRFDSDITPVGIRQTPVGGYFAVTICLVVGTLAILACRTRRSKARYRSHFVSHVKGGEMPLDPCDREALLGPYGTESSVYEARPPILELSCAACRGNDSTV